MPLDLLDRLQHILIFADKVADKIVYEETEILEPWTRPHPLVVGWERVLPRRGAKA